MGRKLFLGSTVLMALCFNACSPYQRGYRSGLANGQYQYGWKDGYETSKGRGLTEKVRDLEMHNAALKAANKHLLNLDCK